MTAWTEHTIETAQGARVPVRVYGKKNGAAPVVLYLHGGAFTGGSAAACERVPALLVQAGAVAVSADYPLAPAHRFPHALEAMFDVLGALQRCCAEWASRRSRVFVAGEEAGGNLAAALALMARDRRAPLGGQILFSPMLDPVMGTCSLRSAEVGAVGCPWADGWHAYLGSPDKAAHPYASPLGATRLAGVAPALIVSAADDPLRDESEAYARQLRKAGVEVRHHVLAAPTNWPFVLGTPIESRQTCHSPDALPASNPVHDAAREDNIHVAGTPDNATESPWAGAVVGQLKTFFAGAAAARRVAVPA
jgi:acetyl esterase/lipase